MKLHDRVRATLGLIGKTYSGILDDRARPIVLPAAQATVTSSWKAYEAGMGSTWGYRIEDTEPLRFIESKVRGLGLRADIYGRVQWKDNTAPVEQNIVVRLWSDNNRFIYDPDLDSPNVLDKMADPDRKHSGRVISRFHFDFDIPKEQSANPGAKTTSGENHKEFHPIYHLQFGGISKDYELCWLREHAEVPRFAYPPMELFLSCQLIAMSLFWSEYQALSAKAEWKAQLKWYQREFLRTYYQRCLSILDAEESLLDGLGLRG